MSTREELPDGWVEKTIGDLVHQKVPQDGPEHDSSFVYVDISSVNNEAKRIDDPRTLTSAEAPSRARQRLEHGDVLVSMTRPNLNAVAIVPESLHGAIGSTGFDVLRPKEVIPGWLFYAVQSNAFIRAMCELVQGALYPAVRPRDIRAYRLAVPPLSEQRRIAEKIDDLFSDLDAGSASLTRAKANLKRYRASVLKAAVEGRLTEEWRKAQPQAEDGQMLLDRILRERREKWERDQLAGFAAKGKEPPKNWQSTYKEPATSVAEDSCEQPIGWTRTTVGQIASSVTTGGTPSRKDSRYWIGGTIPWVTSSATNDSVVNQAQEYITPLAVEETNAKILAPGTLLVALYGEGKTRGQMTELGISAATNQACAALTFEDFNACVRGFIKTYFAHNYHSLRRLSAGGVQPNLSVSLIREMAIPFPPIAEQEEIVLLVDERLSQIDAAEATIDTELIRSKKLRQGILKQAFEGTLVPQHPGDEPASILLDRIRDHQTAPDRAPTSDADAGARSSSRNQSATRRSPSR